MRVEGIIIDSRLEFSVGLAYFVMGRLWGCCGAFGGIMGQSWGNHGALRGIKGLPPPVDIYILVLGLVARGELHYVEIMGMDYDIDGLWRQYRGLREYRGCSILKDEAGRNVKDPRHPVDG